MDFSRALRQMGLLIQFCSFPLFNVNCLGVHGFLHTKATSEAILAGAESTTGAYYGRRSVLLSDSKEKKVAKEARAWIAGKLEASGKARTENPALNFFKKILKTSERIPFRNEKSVQKALHAVPGERRNESKELDSANAFVLKTSAADVNLHWTLVKEQHPTASGSQRERKVLLLFDPLSKEAAETEQEEKAKHENRKRMEKPVQKIR